MNYKKLGKILGKIMILEGALMLAPLIVSLAYNEGFMNALAFLVPVVALVGIGFILQIPRVNRETLYQKEGFALVAAVWIIMTLFGAIPFVINGDIPNYINALFEMTSGFTTTGASIVADVTVLAKSSLFWRSFSHWIGGMGILVFILIFIPESNEGSAMHLLRAESPGPQVGKIVSKMKVTTRILYLIYLGMTLLEFSILLFDKPIAGYENDKVFLSMLTTFGSAGTGGFGVINGSIQAFNPFSQYVIAIFLILFGCNFALYYLLLIGKVKHVLKSGELRAYFVIVFGAIAIIFITLITSASKIPQGYTTEEAFRHSLFQVASIVTTTGYTTTDFNVWPSSCKTVLLLLMFMGGMAGSTAGGMKTSRVVIMLKGLVVKVRKLINPRYVPKMKIEGKILEEKTVNDVFSFVALYFVIVFVVTLLLSFDGVNGEIITVTSDAGTYQVEHGFFSNLSSTISCMSNIGPGFDAVSPYLSFAGYNAFSKIILTFTMILGRLEILPVLILFSRKTYKRT